MRIAMPIAMLFSVATTSLKAEISQVSLLTQKDNYWVVIASRNNPQESIQIASSLRNAIPSAMVVRSENDWYAVVAGPIRTTDIKATKRAVISQYSLPNDVYLSNGKLYRAIVWPVQATAIQNVAKNIEPTQIQPVVTAPSQSDQDANNNSDTGLVLPSPIGATDTVRLLNNAAIAKAASLVKTGSYASVAPATISESNEYAYISLSTGRSVYRKNIYSAELNWNENITFACSKSNKYMDVAVFNTMQPQAGWPGDNFEIRVGTERQNFYSTRIYMIKDQNVNAVRTNSISNIRDIYELARFIHIAARGNKARLPTQSTITYAMTVEQARYVTSACGFPTDFNPDIDTQTAIKQYENSKQSTVNVSASREKDFEDWYALLRQKFSEDNFISQVVYNSKYSSSNTRKFNTNISEFYTKAKLDCSQGSGTPQSSSWPFDPALVDGSLPSAYVESTDLDVSDVVRFKLYRSMLNCQNLQSPEVFYNNFMEGRFDKRDLQHAQFNNEWLRLGAMFNDPTSQEIMMIATRHYGTETSSFPSDTGIPVQEVKALNIPSALAWGMLAEINGSTNARKFIKEHIYPNTSEEVGLHAVSIARDFSQMRISFFTTKEERRGQLGKLAEKGFPNLRTLNFNSMDVGAGAIALRDQEYLFKTQFSSGGLAEAEDRREMLVRACTNTGWNLSGPPSMINRLRQERWDNCIKEYQIFQQMYREKIIEYVVKNGS